MHLHYPEEAQTGMDAPAAGCEPCRRYRLAQLHVACRGADFEAAYGDRWKHVARKQWKKQLPLPPPCHEKRVARIRAMRERGFVFEPGELIGTGVGEDELQ